jgi:hypothetical protein
MPDFFSASPFYYDQTFDFGFYSGVPLAKKHLFDLTECFRMLVKHYQDQDMQDLLKSYLKVTTLSSKSEKTILKEVLLDIKEQNSSIHDSYFRFYIKNAKHSFHLKGYWHTADNQHCGYDVFSLVQFIRRGNELDAVTFVAKCLGINLSNVNVNQCEKLEGYTFIRDSSVYPGGCSPPLDHQILDRPPTQYYSFCNDNGYPSFYLLEWEQDKKAIQIFLTLQQNPETGEVAWKFISPPYEFMIFNRHLINHNSELEVYIHDQISRVYFCNLEHVIATWSGDLSISSKLDWSFLKGRSVSFLFDKNNSDSMKIGAELIKKFSDMGTKLRLCAVQI